MSTTRTSDRAAAMGAAYSTDVWADWPEVFDDLKAKDANRKHVVSHEKINNIFRAVLTFDHLRANLQPGARIVDMGCGIGYNACYLAKLGYDVSAFDASERGIERARELAGRLGLDGGMFHNVDQSFLGTLPDDSLDAAIGMGFIYSLDEPARDYIYRHLARVLRKEGIVALTLTNQLFNAFSLNDTSLDFWTGIIESFSPVARKLGGARKALAAQVQVPTRAAASKSISARFGIHADNPVTYGALAAQYGFELEEILYPDSNLLPPFLEAQIDRDELCRLKAEICVQNARDWRGMFMDYEFLAFLRKA